MAQKIKIIDKIKALKRRKRFLLNSLDKLRRTRPHFRRFPIYIKQRRIRKNTEEIKEIEGNIKKFEKELQSERLMDDEQIKKRLMKEEKEKLRIERLRDEVRRGYS